MKGLTHDRTRSRVQRRKKHLHETGHPRMEPPGRFTLIMINAVCSRGEEGLIHKKPRSSGPKMTKSPSDDLEQSEPNTGRNLPGKSKHYRQVTRRSSIPLSSLEKAIKAALDRIKEGTFGFCVKCGSPISAERFDASHTHRSANPVHIRSKLVKTIPALRYRRMYDARSSRAETSRRVIWASLPATIP